MFKQQSPNYTVTQITPLEKYPHGQSIAYTLGAFRAKNSKSFSSRFSSLAGQYRRRTTSNWARCATAYACPIRTCSTWARRRTPPTERMEATASNSTPKRHQPEAACRRVWEEAPAAAAIAVTALARTKVAAASVPAVRLRCPGTAATHELAYLCQIVCVSFARFSELWKVEK